MHLPDGYLNNPVCFATTAAAAGAIGYGWSRAVRDVQFVGPTAVGLTAAGIFAAQMGNFPIASGTSGHLVGAAAAAVLLGPWLGMFAVALVLVVQCLIFGDGGVTTLCANVLNMAVIGVGAACGVLHLVQRVFRGDVAKALGAGLGAFAAVIASAAACSLELGLSATYNLPEVLWAMLPIHAAIGLAEGLFTAALAAMALRTRPVVSGGKALVGPTGGLGRGFLAAAVVAVFAAATLVGLAASSLPDGLDRVAIELGFDDSALALNSGLMPDYALSGLGSESLSVALAGLCGALLVFSLAWSTGRVARRAAHRNV